MTIAILNLYQGLNTRGVESFTTDLAKHLGKDNTIDILGPKSISAIAQPSQSLTFRKRLFLDSASLAVLKFTLSIFSKLWHTRYEVLIPTNGFWQVILCKLLVFLRGGKIVITGHSGKGWDERWNLYLSPSVFIATTPQNAAWAKYIAPWVRVELIPLAVDIAKFKHAKPEKLKLKSPVVLCPSAADPYKRIDLAVEAVAKIPGVSLLHLGRGASLASLQHLGHKLLGTARFLSQSVPYSTIPGYFKASSIVTFPSASYESFGIVLLEALAAGKFVVATDTPQNRWILGPAGIFVDPTDLSSYVAGLKEALSKPLPTSELEEHLNQFSWATVAKSYSDLLTSL